MPEFKPRTAAREEKRQANEALGRSFCKTLAEPITNSDASAKRKHEIPQSSGLVDLMLKTAKGTQLDTSSLRGTLSGRYPTRRILVDVVTAKSSGRPKGEIVVIDQAEGMSAATLRTALEDIAGDRADLTGGMVGRNLFGRGLSDVMRAHSERSRRKESQPVVQTFDGKELTIARGEWRKDGWWIEMSEPVPRPGETQFRDTFLDLATSGTAVRFVISDAARKQGCRIPDPDGIAYRLANFYMLRLIASDPNVELILRQYRATGVIEDRIEYDFPVGQVIESFSREFDASGLHAAARSLTVDFLVIRADSERPLRGLGLERDARENGMLIADDLDAVYDLTFADLDYERADFLSRIYGLVRVNGLREVCEQYLNDPEIPTSPLRPDREGFNRDHEFSRALLDFIGDALRPIYEKERKLAQDKERGELSAETKKRIDDALKHLNKYFHDITELGGDASGTNRGKPPAPKEDVVFSPKQTRIIAGRVRHVLLLVRDDVIESGAEVIATASEGFSVQPETEQISRKDCPRWSPHEQFFAVRFSVFSSDVGQNGTVDTVVEGKDGDLLEATLTISDVLTEPEIEVPESLEFRPAVATGRPGRRNNLVLYVNPEVISAGHYLRIQITEPVGRIGLLDDQGKRVDRVDVKLNKAKHQVKGQHVFRLLVPWKGTSWNQRARVSASVKVGGAKPLLATARICLDQPDQGGFFEDVQYDDLGEETLAPSMFAAHIITVNARDPLNRALFGGGQTKDELKRSFDQQLKENAVAQQRLAQLLLEEASFRALEHLHLNNELLLAAGREVTAVHDAINKYKYESAHAVHRALVRSPS